MFMLALVAAFLVALPVSASAQAEIEDSVVQEGTVGTGNAGNTAVSGVTLDSNINQNTNQNATQVRTDPTQTIRFGSNTAVDFLNLPGFFAVPNNFSQPYKPESWINGPGAIVPTRLTWGQASSCRDKGVKDSWDGGQAPQTSEIALIWPSLGQKVTKMNGMGMYLGTSKVRSTEKYSFMATVCEAAYQAMKHGATRAIVAFVHRAKNKMSGFGFGGSAGASGVPDIAASSAYAAAGALGFGTGVSRQYVEGELLIHMTTLRDQVVAKVIPEPAAPRAPGAKPAAKPAAPAGVAPAKAMPDKPSKPVADKDWHSGEYDPTRGTNFGPAPKP